MRYIRGAYGDPLNAWAYHRAHGTYDSGGVARGTGWMPKQTIKPERVLSPKQTESFDRLVTLLERGGVGGPMVHIDTMNTRDAKTAAYEIRREQMKVAAMMRLT